MGTQQLDKSSSTQSSAAEQGEPDPGAWNCLEAAGSQDLPTVHRQHKGVCDPSGFTSGGGAVGRLAFTSPLEESSGTLPAPATLAHRRPATSHRYQTPVCIVFYCTMFTMVVAYKAHSYLSQIPNTSLFCIALFSIAQCSQWL